MSTPDANDSQRPPVPAYTQYPTQQPTPPPYGQQPQYGQYAQPAYGQPQYGQPQYGQPQYYGGKPPVRTADAIVSVILLVFGLVGAFTGVTAAFQLEPAMQQQHTDLGLGPYVATGSLVGSQAALILSHVLLFLISTPITIVLIVKRKISFWVPLSAGVLAGLVFWIVLFVLIFTDPTLMDSYQSPSQF